MDHLILFITEHPILVGTFLVLLIALLVTEQQKGGKNITSSELVHFVNKEEGVVLDLRDPANFNAGHITKAVNIPQSSLKKRVSEIHKFKERPIILVCNQGLHSGAAGQILRKEGFTHILRLKGGIQSWITDNLPLVKS